MSPLIYLLAGLAILILLTLRKVHPFLALILAACFTGLTAGLGSTGSLAAMEKGIGQTLSSTLLILTLGGAYGSILEKSGAISSLTTGILRLFGPRYLLWGLMLISFLIGLPLFYNAAFILLFPLVSGLILQTGLPSRVLALPMVAALSITHALTPPHPAPATLAGLLNANISLTLLWGLCIALPAAALGGPVLSLLYKSDQAVAPASEPEATQTSQPGRNLAVVMALLPILLMATGSLINSGMEGWWTQGLRAISMPAISMLLAVVVAIFVLGINRGTAIQEVMQWLVKGMENVFIILIIIAAGGAFKEILVAAGVADALVHLAGQWQIHPLLYGWVLAAIIRVAIGSATVAALTAAGLIAPHMAQMGVPPELMVLSIGSGSIFFSHINDAGFWMFKEFFQLSLKETFLSWTLMETCISLAGLAGVWIIYMFAL